jgi:hypothetical protein
LKLEPHELESAAAKKLAAHYAERLEMFRRQNDGDMDDRSTTKVRGRIAEIKALLAIIAPEQAIPGAE